MKFWSLMVDGALSACLLTAVDALASENLVGHAKDGRWNEIFVYAGGGYPVSFPAVVFEPSRDLMIMIGDGATAKTLSDGLPYPVSNAGHPSAGVGDAWLVDVRRSRIILIPNHSNAAANLWIMHLDDTLRWSALQRPGAPPPSAHGTVVLDTRRDRAVFFGGMRFTDGRYVAHDETWALSLGDLLWSRLASDEHGPAPRFHHSAIYDPIHDRMIVHGGVPDARSPGLQETWELSFRGEGWRPLRTHGVPAPARHYHSAIYDPRAARMVLFGGMADAYTGGVPPTLAEVWELTLRGRTRWKRLDPAGDPPQGLVFLSAAYDPMRDRMIVGYDHGAWALDWSERSLVSAFDSSLRHSADPEFVPLVGRVDVVVFDVQGRIVARHRIDDWTTAVASGFRLRAGLSRGAYFARLRSERAARVVRLVVVR